MKEDKHVPISSEHREAPGVHREDQDDIYSTFVDHVGHDSHNVEELFHDIHKTHVEEPLYDVHATIEYDADLFEPQHDYYGGSHLILNPHRYMEDFYDESEPIHID